MTALGVDEENVSTAAIKENTPEKQVFIIGSRRSGTTWTLWLLSNHPSMVGVQHTNLIDAFKKIDKWWKDEERIHNTIISGGSEKSKKNLKDFISSDGFYSQCSQIINMVFSRAFNEKKQAKIVVESQPENIDNLDLLMNLFPDAYYLHIIRDPRSVFSSWKTIATTWSNADVFKTHPVEFSKRWREDVTTGRSFADKAENYLEIKYEELQSDGISVLQNVYEWLKIDSSSEIATEAIDACEIQKLRKKANMPKGFFRKGLSDGWKSELSASDIKSVEYLLADVMDDLGYERVNKGKILTPLKINIFNARKRFIKWLKNTFLFNLLRKIKERILG